MIENFNYLQPSFQDAIDGLIRKHLKNVWTMSFAEIVKIDRDKRLADVRLLHVGFTISTTGEKQPFEYPELKDLPIPYMTMGGTSIDIGYDVGDQVLIGFSCRNIQNYVKGDSEIYDAIYHDINESFIVGPMPKQPIDTPMADAGAIKIIGSGTLDIECEGDISITGSGSLSITTSSDISVEIDGGSKIEMASSSVKINGNLEVLK